jgi:hypothetical protein
VPSRKGASYAITPEWQKWVRERIEQLKREEKIKSDTDFAVNHAKISKAALSEALKPGRVETNVMIEIHKGLGWPPPAKGLHPKVLEFLYLFIKLDDGTRGEMLGELRERVARARAK